MRDTPLNAGFCVFFNYGADSLKAGLLSSGINPLGFHCADSLKAGLLSFRQLQSIPAATKLVFPMDKWGFMV